MLSRSNGIRWEKRCAALVAALLSHAALAAEQPPRIDCSDTKQMEAALAAAEKGFSGPSQEIIKQLDALRAATVRVNVSLQAARVANQMADDERKALTEHSAAVLAALRDNFNLPDGDAKKIPSDKLHEDANIRKLVGELAERSDKLMTVNCRVQIFLQELDAAKQSLKEQLDKLDQLKEKLRKIQDDLNDQLKNLDCQPCTKAEEDGQAASVRARDPLAEEGKPPAEKREPEAVRPQTEHVVASPCAAHFVSQPRLMPQILVDQEPRDPFVWVDSFSHLPLVTTVLPATAVNDFRVVCKDDASPAVAPATVDAAGAESSAHGAVANEPFNRTETSLDDDQARFCDAPVICDYRFDHPARFPLPEFGYHHELLEREGVLIYEGMRLMVRRDGRYQVRFVAGTPPLPVAMRLQFDLLEETTGQPVTLTLPPIRIPEQARSLSKGMSEVVHPVEARIQTIHHEGYLPVLAANLGSVRVLGRSGTARMGYGVNVP